MSWPEVRLGWVAQAVVPQRDKPETLEGPIPWLRIEDFNGKYLSTSKSGQGVTAAQVAEMPLRVIPQGSVVCSCSCTMGATAIAAKPLVTNQTFIGLIPAEGELDSCFLYYYLQGIQEHLQMRSSGAIQQYLSKDEFLSLRIPLPPLDVQRRIADFLDDQTVRIDALLDARHRQAELLGRRPWLAFDEALSRFRGSSCPLRRALVSVSDGPFGSAFSSSDYVFEGHPVVRLGNIGFAEFRWTSLAAVPNGIYERFPTAQIHSGDLLIASLGDEQNHAGRACVAPDGLKGALVKGKCFRAQVDRRHAEPQFLAVALSGPTGASVMSELSRGATRKMINIEILKGAVIPLPRVEEQRAMLADFGILRTQASELLDRIALASDLLYERKRSLITAAVTGEFDVSSASSRAADVVLSGVGGGL